MATSRISPQWKTLYEAAILELDLNKMLERIAEAERAITACIDIEKMSPTGDRSDKVQTLMNALTVMRDLREMATDYVNGAGDEEIRRGAHRIE